MDEERRRMKKLLTEVAKIPSPEDAPSAADEALISTFLALVTSVQAADLFKVGNSLQCRVSLRTTRGREQKSKTASGTRFLPFVVIFCGRDIGVYCCRCMNEGMHTQT